MASATKVSKYPAGRGNTKVERLSEASIANTAKSLSTPTGKPRRLIFASVKYSAAPTQAGVTFDLDSGAGAAYDTNLSTGSANAQNSVFIPSNDFIICDDDIIKVTAPAGGAAITSQIVIHTEPYG